MLMQLAAHIFVLVARKLFFIDYSSLYNFLIIILKFSIIKNDLVMASGSHYVILLLNSTLILCTTTY